MKKIAAFLTALVIFIVCVIGFHFAVNGQIATNNPHFGTWINNYKDLSYQAIRQNIHDDTVLMLGSSEFQHGKKTKYHPSRVFREQNMDVMCVGAAYHQSLSHAITVASVAPEMKTKKVVLMLSPSWFIEGGVKKTTFPVRFSESQYVAMLKNPGISIETKKTIATRCVDLLSEDEAMLNRVERYNRVYLSEDSSLIDNAISSVRRAFVEEQENMTVSTAWKKSGLKSYKEYEPLEPPKEGPDWKTLREEAEQDVDVQREDRFYMTDKVYEKKIIPRLERKKDSDLGRSYEKSLEYGDLKTFLDVCKEAKLEVMLVLLPVNGYWYDYTGFPREGREKFVTGVEAVAKDYSAQVCNMFDYCYTPGFFEDAVHPTEKGWLEINEKVYQFYRKS